jgi:hypothetical protein
MFISILGKNDERGRLYKSQYLKGFLCLRLPPSGLLRNSDVWFCLGSGEARTQEQEVKAAVGWL